MQSTTFRGPTFFNGDGGSDAFTVGNAGSVQAIAGALNIENTPSYNTVTVDDSSDATARTVTIDTITTVPGDADPYGSITGLAPAAINFEYADTTSATVHTPMAGGSTTTIARMAIPLKIVGHSPLPGPNDTINVGNPTSLVDITAPLTFDNARGYTSVFIDSSSDSGIGSTFSGFIQGNESWGKLAAAFATEKDFYWRGIAMAGSGIAGPSNAAAGRVSAVQRIASVLDEGELMKIPSPG